ncbi:hypothetical protein RSAG8_00159, partial [Rhizoctonia solani AG-8 WAC10335]
MDRNRSRRMLLVPISKDYLWLNCCGAPWECGNDAERKEKSHGGTGYGIVRTQIFGVCLGLTELITENGKQLGIATPYSSNPDFRPPES